MRRVSVLLAAGPGLLVLSGCLQPGQPLPRRGDEIVAAGQLFHTGTPVVLWLDPKGYDAYRAQRYFTPTETMPARPAAPGNPNRYGERHVAPQLAEQVAAQGWTLANLQQSVDQFVIHYDVCGTSRRCFEVLQDLRGLSVPFLLDVDGTIYQTLDLKERAWHAGTANDRSVGIEIAHIGAYPNMTVLDQWYRLDAGGWPCVTFPASLGETGIRTPGFVARPARRELIRGTINGRELVQYDFTDEQYHALSRLTATLVRVLPNLRLQVPRGPDGRVRPTVLSPAELADYQGLLAHWHVTTVKIDPGPAFDWDRVLHGAARALGMSL